MLEIIESLLLRDDDRTWTDLEKLHRTGIKVAIDDFGTDYSSLSYLRQLSIDVVKVDKDHSSGSCPPRHSRGRWSRG